MAMRHGLLYGVWVFATFVGPLGLAWRVQAPWAWLLAAGLVLAHIACIPHWQARVRRLLSSTKWARERGYTADLRLFQFRLR